MEEIKQKDDLITAHAKLNNILRFGLYPEVFDKNESFAIEELNNIASNYLYKDILQFELANLIAFNDCCFSAVLHTK